MNDLEVLDYKEIEGDFAQKYFITIGLNHNNGSYIKTHFNQGIHRDLYKWAVNEFGLPSNRWNWRKVVYGGCFQFRDKSDCILLRLRWIKN